jgi:hypothetical protein
MLRIVMLRAGVVVTCCLLLAAAPTRAQNSDIFREDAPPAAAPPPKLAPRPRIYSPPEPAAVAPAPQPAVVAPAPTVPSASQLWAKVRQAAASQGIAVPLASSPPFDVAGTPPQYRTLLGAWGPGTWQGNPAGDRMIFVIEGVNDGSLRGVVGKSSDAWLPAMWSAISTSIAGTRFGVDITNTSRVGIVGQNTNHAILTWSFEMRPDGTLTGSRDNGASTVVLPRLQ